MLTQDEGTMSHCTEQLLGSSKLAGYEMSTLARFRRHKDAETLQCLYNT